MDTTINSLAIPAQLVSIAALILFCSELFLNAESSKRKFFLSTSIGLLWITILSLLSYSGFLLQNEAMPPRMILVLGPPILLIMLAAISKSSRQKLAMMSFSFLTLFHVIRIAAELMIHHSYKLGEMPLMLTFEGQNPDILIGILAPIVWFFFARNRVNRSALWIWNVVGLIFLANIVVRAVLSIPSPLQSLNFDVPNVAVLKYPMVLLPGLMVPLVFAAHVISIVKLSMGKKDVQNAL